MRHQPVKRDGHDCDFMNENHDAIVFLFMSIPMTKVQCNAFLKGLGADKQLFKAWVFNRRSAELQGVLYLLNLTHVLFKLLPCMADRAH